VVYSTASAWRRGASLGWAALVARLQRGRPLLRLELHPPDVEHEAICRSWQRILGDALEHREPMTLDSVTRLAL
jgi:predicted deacetylase